NPPVIVTSSGEVRYSFVCRKNPSVKINRARHDDSTSNLVWHVDGCEPQSSSAIAAFAGGSSYNPTKHRIAEDQELREIFYDLNNRVQHPSAMTVSRDVKEIFKISLENLAKILQLISRRILDFFTLAWMDVISFLGITVHWIRESKMETVILDFVK
ncbi:hypothetical protein DFH07DRAFT_749036, partial [Mycena maculata]